MIDKNKYNIVILLLQQKVISKSRRVGFHPNKSKTINNNNKLIKT